MLEAKYFRDYKHSYMILPCKIRQPEKSYPCRQLTSNKIEEILRCSMRHVNGMTYFYYDISSRTTLESLYRDRQMSYCQIRELFEQLYDIYCRIGDYFMDETRLVFLPEHIYYDLSRKKYIGLYYPDYEEDKPYEVLMDYLLEHMDGQDEHLTDCVYQIYERAEDSGFSLWDALQILENAKEQGKERERTADIFLLHENNSFESEMEGPAYTQTDMYDPQEDSFVPWEEKEEVPVPARNRKNSPFFLFLAMFSAMGLAGIAYIYNIYNLSAEETMTLLGCGVLMGVCFLAGLTGILRGGAKGGKTEKNKGADQSEGIEKVKSTEKIEKPREIESIESREPWRPAPAGKRKSPPEEEENFGNTVFFDGAKATEYKLYALDKKNKKHIELTKFPYTIGKMAGCVDCVLPDDSVSRIHARFEKVGDTIQLTDMNSTNGTYRNGLRMQPQETVEIEPGDEIRFGNLNYCYR